MERQKKVKQVVVVRKDIKMPQGKLCAQVAHASLAAILNQGYFHEATKSMHLNLDDASYVWLNEEFTKVVVYVKSEAELQRIYREAKELGLACSIIKDAGYTVFNEPTYTTCAVGPGFIEEVDRVTKGLPLV